jgi:hypothetical protein
MTAPLTPETIGFYFISCDSELIYPVAGLRPEDYLESAKEDFANFTEEKDPRHLLNAVSNAKRALHYQVEALAKALGWEHIKSRNDFPSKMNFLRSCDVLSPTIIGRINRFRNIVEHDYYIPKENEALEYLEIVELYLRATSYTSMHFPDEPDAFLMSDADGYDPNWNYPERIFIRLPQGEGKLTIETDDQILVQVTVAEPIYFEWVSTILFLNEA